jgi:hypothetical protein
MCSLARVEWESSNPAIVSARERFDLSAWVEGESSGNATVRVGNHGRTASITVTSYPVAPLLAITASAQPKSQMIGMGVFPQERGDSTQFYPYSYDYNWDGVSECNRTEWVPWVEQTPNGPAYWGIEYIQHCQWEWSFSATASAVGRSTSITRIEYGTREFGPWTLMPADGVSDTHASAQKIGNIYWVRVTDDRGNRTTKQVIFP